MKRSVYLAKLRHAINKYKRNFPVIPVKISLTCRDKKYHEAYTNK